MMKPNILFLLLTILLISSTQSISLNMKLIDDDEKFETVIPEKDLDNMF